MSSVAYAEGVTLEIDGQLLGVSLPAPHPGRFLRRHPARGDDVARPGQILDTGAMLGLIAFGPVLVPLAMPAPGLLLAFRIAHGAPVGHGDPVVDYVPLADLAALGVTP
jgi:hypothetical protein